MNSSDFNRHLESLLPDDPERPPVHFVTNYRGSMEMYSSPDVVAEYLDNHAGWFHRCAHPMKVEPFTHQGYILTVGRFGTYGYEVEPRIAVLFDPPKNGKYPMYNVPIPGETHQGYVIDYKASMSLKDVPWEEADQGIEKRFKKQGDCPIPERITRINWELHLKVLVQFPHFVYKLPHNFIRSTGDRLLSGVVRQISPRFTVKVQQDFHQLFNLPIPPKTAHTLQYLAPPSAMIESHKEDNQFLSPKAYLSRMTIDG